MNKVRDKELTSKKNKKSEFVEDSNYFSMMKLWSYMKRKSIKSRNIEKLQTPYDFKDILEQNSDNESDKTKLEEECRITNNRGRKANSMKSNKSNGSNKTKYNKRDRSLDIVRNSNDDYEVVLPYQRYIRLTK